MVWSILQHEITVNDFFDMSQEDLREEEKIELFFGPGTANCCEKKCNKTITQAVAVKQRYVSVI